MGYLDILDRLYKFAEDLEYIRNDVDDLMSANRDYLADIREKEERIEELSAEVEMLQSVAKDYGEHLYSDMSMNK